MVGKRLGHYEILEPLGAGGMGEVYRARDTKLDRDVAIKVLPEDVAADPERLARFTREAKLLATLSHPNIAGVFGLEEEADTSFIAMELVEGETLAHLIARSGRIDLDAALDIAGQIAEALEAAHEAGIIHRDVKPANVLLTAKGGVKVLDFGIAKSTLLGRDASAALTEQATSLTVDGALMGTPPYMAPEQIRGEDGDKRADIWAFGCVLYEMLAGKAAFARETVADTLVAVLELEPDWGALPSDTPMLVQSVLRRCLRKDPHRRLHDVADARIELDEATMEPTTKGVGAARRERPAGWRKALSTIAAVAIGALVTAVVAWTLWPDPPGPRSSDPETRFTHELADGQRLVGGRALAVTADGRLLAYFAEGTVRRLRGSSERTLQVRPLNDADGAREVAGIPDGRVTDPFFSPAGESIGYYVRRTGELQQVPVDGGQPTLIAELAAPPQGPSWSGDSVYYGQPAGIFRAPANGVGEPTLVVAAQEDEQLYGPQLLPDGESILFTVNEGGGEWNRARIAIESPSGKRTVLDPVGHDARYVGAGHLLYARNGDLWAVALDVDERAIVGEPVVVGRGLQVAGAVAQYAVSDRGVLAFARPDPALRTLERVNRDGIPEPIVAPPNRYTIARVSPDGSKLALTISADGGGDIAVLDRDRPGDITYVARSPAVEVNPVWMTSDELVFTRFGDGEPTSLYRIAVNRVEDPVALTNGMHDGEFPQFIFPDGSRVVFRRDVPREDGGLTYDLFELSLDGEERAEPVLETDDERFVNADVSPDGRHLAYESNREGELEIFIAPVDDPYSYLKVSQGGGVKPVWSRSGDELELFYVTSDASSPRLMSVQMDTTGPRLVPRTPVPLFDVESYYLGLQSRNYDVDGEGRFVFIRDSPPQEIRIAVNWLEELERPAPPGR